MGSQAFRDGEWPEEQPTEEAAAALDTEIDDRLAARLSTSTEAEDHTDD